MSQVTEKRAFVRKGRKERKEERKKNDGRGECHTVQSTTKKSGRKMTGAANATQSSRPSAIFASFAFFAS
jgi:hypothetical protein